MSDQVAEMSATYLVEAAQDAVPVGYKQTEVGVIPNDWSMLSLSQIVAALESGVSVNSVDRAEAFPHGMHILKTSCVNGGYFYESEVKSILPKDIKRAKCPAVKGSIIISRMNTPALVGELGYVPRDYPYSFLPDRLWQMRLNKESETDSRWLAYLLSYPKISRKIKESATGTSGSMKNISKGNFLSLQIPYPEPEEQTAIANALSDVDALISELEKLIAKKQAIKTATMQQLLTGRTRLPQFALHEDGTPKGYKQSELGEIPEDWNINPLKLLLKENPKYGINAPAVPLQGKLPVYIRITDISEDGYFKPSEKVGVNSQLSNLYHLKDGDIVLARTGASVGKSYLYRKEDGLLVYAGFLIKISPEKEKLNPAYLSQYFKTERYWMWVIVNSMRSGQPGINGSEYGDFLLTYPSVEEQNAIASILSDMDDEIQTLEQRLGKTRQIKQGMMQELLTGKTRLVASAA